MSEPSTSSTEAPTVAIVGASTNRDKFGNRSLRAHQQNGYTVYPVNPKEDEIEGLRCYPDLESVPKPLNRISMYVPPSVGEAMLDQLVAAQPDELWLNPGAESESFIAQARDRGLNVIVACSIIALGR